MRTCHKMAVTTFLLGRDQREGAEGIDRKVTLSERRNWVTNCARDAVRKGLPFRRTTIVSKEASHA